MYVNVCICTCLCKHKCIGASIYIYMSLHVVSIYSYINTEYSWTTICFVQHFPVGI